MTGQAIFISGPIGAGKTTLGRAVATRLDGKFFDGDDYAVHSKPWYASSLSTNRRIADAVLSALRTERIAVVAYPLRQANYVYFRRRVTEAGHRVVFVTLRASIKSILGPSRGRLFDADEERRAAEMIQQGYADRPFSDLIVDTDIASFGETVDMLLLKLQARNDSEVCFGATADPRSTRYPPNTNTRERLHRRATVERAKSVPNFAEGLSKCWSG